MPSLIEWWSGRKDVAVVRLHSDGEGDLVARSLTDSVCAGGQASCAEVEGQQSLSVPGGGGNHPAGRCTTAKLHSELIAPSRVSYGICCSSD